MKKRDDSGHKSEFIRGIRFTLDDLEYISEALRQAGLEVTFFDSIYEYDSLQDFIDKRGERPAELKVEGREREGRFESVSVDFNRSRAYLSSSRPSKLYYELREFLNKKRPWTFFVLNPWVWGFSLIIFLNLFLPLSKTALSPLTIDGLKILFFFSPRAVC